MLKNIFKYTISLLVAFGLLWYVYKDLNMNALLAKLGEVDYKWVVLSMILFLGSHATRAYRWNLLLSPIGFRPGLFRTFLAVMVGYFANLLLPRMGEITRCGMLKRTDDIPVTTSLGTVVAERIIDVFSLLAVIIFALVVEFERLKGFFLSFVTGTLGKLNVQTIIIVAGILIILLVLGVFIIKKNKTQIRENAIYKRLNKLGKELIHGILSINKLQQRGQFWASTILMWLFYYLTSYFVFFSLPETSGLGLLAALSVLVMGSLGMAAPVQGGIGTFHILVSGVLVLYGVSQSDGVLFATLIHGIQTLSFVVFGAISFAVSLLISRRETREQIIAKAHIK